MEGVYLFLNALALDFRFLNSHNTSADHTIQAAAKTPLV
jgi:hypothetical protein